MSSLVQSPVGQWRYLLASLARPVNLLLTAGETSISIVTLIDIVLRLSQHLAIDCSRRRRE